MPAIATRRARRALATAAAGTAALVLAGSAQAADSATFRVTVKGSQTVTWTEPRHAPHFLGDGYHRYWTEGGGEERITFRTRPRRYVAELVGGRIQFSPEVDLRRPVDELDIGGLDGTATVTRSSRRLNGSDPGPLGGTAEQQEFPFSDCGTRRESWDVFLDTPRRGRVAIRAQEGVVPYASRSPQPTLTDCTLFAPKGVEQGDLTVVRADLPTSEVLDGGLGRIIVLGDKSWQEQEAVGSGGTLTRTAKVHWELRLDRIGGGPRR